MSPESFIYMYNQLCTIKYYVKIYVAENNFAEVAAVTLSVTKPSLL